MRITIALLLIGLATPAVAQGPDDCPPGHARHQTFSGLDRPSMVAAITASFIGLHHRPPTGVPGSGSDDVAYWVQTADHFGLYGDDVCRAGWNLYRENQLGGLPTGPADGDQPARFQPTAPPQPVPPPVPPSQPPLPPVPSSEGVLLAKIDALAARVSALYALDAEQSRAAGDAHAAIHQLITDFRAEQTNRWEQIRPVVVFTSKYVVPIATTWYLTQKAVRP